MATRIARDMVTRFGMSEKLGPRTFGRREELVFLGREISEQRDYSDRVAEQIDNEVHILLETAHNTAEKILTDNEDKLKQMAQFLIQHETIEGEELARLFSIDPLASEEEVTSTVRGPETVSPKSSSNTKRSSTRTKGPTSSHRRRKGGPGAAAAPAS